MSQDIESEAKLFWKILWNIFLIPFKLILIPFKKYSIVDLFQPIIDIYNFLIQSKFTLILIVLNLIFFLLELVFGESFINLFGTYPNDLLIPSRFYSFITAGFIHFGFDHLFWNMLALFIFGRAVEKQLGTAKTFFVYFGSLIFANIFADALYLFSKTEIMLGGASGAIMGIMALAMLLAPFQLSFISIIPMPMMILAWIYIFSDIMGVINPTNDGISHFAHIGGFLSVTAIYYMIGGEDKSKLRKGLIINVISAAVLGVIYFLFLK